MYFADPQEGRRRRARLRDVVVHTSHILETATGRTTRDIENRTAGLAARAAASLVPQPPPIDDVLAARVRARLGRLVSHPGAIEAKAASGRITLSGPVFEAEVEQLLEGVRAVPGVTHVENQLESHAQAGDISALQGPGPLKLHGAPSDWVPWTPATRVMAGATGLALMAWAARHRTMRGTAVGLTGFELLEQAVCDARAGGQAKATS
jgi:hypothetical protein